MSQQRAKRKKKATTKKVSYKDKAWYEIIAPKSFNFKPIGEIIGLEKNILERTIENLLFDFTDDLSDINLKLKYKVTSVNEEAKKCNTTFIGHSYTNDFIRSLIGRGSTKIATIQNLTTKDGYIFRITTICITIKRARSSQQIIIRKIMRDILKEFAKSLNHEKFINGMIYGEFQSQIGRVAKTIYPLSSATVIKSKLVSYPEGSEDQEVADHDFDSEDGYEGCGVDVIPDYSDPDDDSDVRSNGPPLLTRDELRELFELYPVPDTDDVGPPEDPSILHADVQEEECKPLYRT